MEGRKRIGRSKAQESKRGNEKPEYEMEAKQRRKGRRGGQGESEETTQRKKKPKGERRREEPRRKEIQNGERVQVRIDSKMVSRFAFLSFV